MTQPLILGLLFSGGITFWLGLLNGWRFLVLIGASALAGVFSLFLLQGFVSPFALLLVLTTGGLALSIKSPNRRGWMMIGWSLYLALVLALGFRLFPLFTGVPIFEAVGIGTPFTFHFPPEKIILMWVVPPMMLVPLAAAGRFSRFGHDRPWLTTTSVFVVTLCFLIPSTMLLDYAQPGLTPESVPFLLYRLSYNYLFTCVLEECFFRGIIQTGVIRGLQHLGLIRPAALLGIVVTALLFGLAHVNGGPAYMWLASIAGTGYGAAYYLTGRIHAPVLIHFFVNAVHKLFFAVPPMVP